MSLNKKIFISFGILVVALIGLFFLYVIGITTNFLTDKIDDSEISKCKEIVNIINKNKAFINDSLYVDAPADGKCIRYYIDESDDVSKLFSKINPSDKKRFEQLVDSKFCKYIEIGEVENCIMFCIKTSYHDSKFVGAYKKMFIIYQKSPECNCSENPVGYPNHPDYVKELSKNWYQTKVHISRRYFGC